MVGWARTVGPHAAEMVERILASFPHPEMGYRSFLGIIRMGQRYPATRVEAAAERALVSGAVSYKSLESILRHNLDQQSLSRPLRRAPFPPTATSVAQLLRVREAERVTSTHNRETPGHVHGTHGRNLAQFRARRQRRPT